MGLRLIVPFAMLMTLAAVPAMVLAEPDPSQVLREAESLARAGKYEEALQKHIWYHENALRIDPAQYGVRLSFALAAWVELGEKYPKARQALVDIRDRTAKQVEETGGPRSRFHDVASIDEYLKDSATTAAVFREVAARHPEEAKEIYPLAEEALFSAGNFALCAAMTPDSMARFDEISEARTSLIDSGKDSPRPDGLKAFAEQKFAGQTTRLVTILAAAGRRDEAGRIRDAALKVQSDAPLRDALDQALRTPPTTGPTTAPSGR